jgi:hypothetical protein
MRNLIALSLMIVSFLSHSIDNELIERALNGDNNAKYLIAVQLIEPKSEFYSPDKAQEMLLSLAKLGDTRAFSPLARIFADPTIEKYSPKRSLFYLTKVEGDTMTREMLYQVLSGKSPSSSLNNINVRQSSPLKGIISALSLYPFTSLSAAQIDQLKLDLKHPSSGPYEPYIYPAILTPLIGNTHLFKVESLSLNENWTFSSVLNRFVPIRDSKGVLSVDIGEGDGQTLTLYYDTANYLAIAEYYSNFLESVPIRNGFEFDAPGVKVIVSRTYNTASVVFNYKTLRPLIQSSVNIPKRLNN